jgi:hypothetical protein
MAGKTTMKDYFFILCIIIGFLFGMKFEKQFRQREKLEAIQTSQQNTVEIIEKSQQIKGQVQNANKKCIDIFNIDITECVQ